MKLQITLRSAQNVFFRTAAYVLFSMTSLSFLRIFDAKNVKKEWGEEKRAGSLWNLVPSFRLFPSARHTSPNFIVVLFATFLQLSRPFSLVSMVCRMYIVPCHNLTFLLCFVFCLFWCFIVCEKDKILRGIQEDDLDEKAKQREEKVIDKDGIHKREANDVDMMLYDLFGHAKSTLFVFCLKSFATARFSLD